MCSSMKPREVGFHLSGGEFHQSDLVLTLGVAPLV
jgi:hypothetical protein